MTILILIMTTNAGEKAILDGEPPLRFVVLMCSLRVMVWVLPAYVVV